MAAAAKTLSKITALLGQCSSWRDMLQGNILDELVQLTHDLRNLEHATSILGVEVDAATLDAQLAAFQQWLEAGMHRSDCVFKVEKVGAHGNGLIAQVDIAEGSQLLSIPAELLLTSALPASLDRLRHDPLCRQFPTVPLALHVLHEAFSPTSRFAPYIAVLPRHFHLPLFYSAADFTALSTSAAAASAIPLFYNALRQYIYLRRLLESSPLPGLPVAAFSLTNYFWSLAVVLTRQNNVPTPKDPSALALIPGWDMCNHAFGRMTTYADADAIVCDAMTSFNAGDEITICYGPRPNSDLLIYSGFSVAINPHDRVPLLVALRPPHEDPLRKIRLLLLEKRGATLTPDGLHLQVLLDAAGRLASPRHRQHVQLLVLDKPQLAMALRQAADDDALVAWQAGGDEAAVECVRAACAAHVGETTTTRDVVHSSIVEYLAHERTIYERAMAHRVF
ncbi:Aste57867_11571 [Aphanomyces stellatus]|uniref:protein-histidine N-methyltransferase n=1 Tax=Aphanomyces stellatus TaxID=120398 RepID=A0A485KTV3_9STRA|nr:hypothetical protein As57867_011528 [Aphanomyces stellatus]VFT88430.1 Aste57867_11571 [Aphanomyces stellatus]